MIMKHKKARACKPSCLNQFIGSSVNKQVKKAPALDGANTFRSVIPRRGINFSIRPQVVISSIAICWDILYRQSNNHVVLELKTHVV